MARTVRTPEGLYVQLNDADPEEAMRNAHREYYQMQAPDVSLLEELIHLGVESPRTMREMEYHELNFS